MVTPPGTGPASTGGLATAGAGAAAAFSSQQAGFGSGSDRSRGRSGDRATADALGVSGAAGGADDGGRAHPAIAARTARRIRRLPVAWVRVSNMLVPDPVLDFRSDSP